MFHASLLYVYISVGDKVTWLMPMNKTAVFKWTKPPPHHFFCMDFNYTNEYFDNYHGLQLCLGGILME